MEGRALQDLLDFAVESAQLAGAFTLGYFNASPSVELKADRSPVTAADRGAEERLRKRIAEHYPDHGVIGEEFGETTGRAPARWILDPIDGTHSFISGVPLYSVLIGFEWQGAVLAGVIHLPALGETVYAARGLGCWWNGRRARVSNVATLSDARLLTNTLKGHEHCGTAAAYGRLLHTCGSDRGSYDAYGYALVATGRAEVCIDPVMHLWDNAALRPVVVEAGGSFTDWSGVESHTARQIVATNGLLQAEVVNVLAG